jgi:hypothetical protein
MWDVGGIFEQEANTNGLAIVGAGVKKRPAHRWIDQLPA